MYHLTDQQIDFILDDIRAEGITMEDLQQNLLDHACILIEENLEEGGDFMAYYTSTIRSFYRQELRELEEEAIFLDRHPLHILLSRGQFFVLLFALFIGPYIAYDITWAFTTGRVNGFCLPMEVLAGTFVFALFPLLTLLVLLLTPDRLDPVIPRRAKILLGFRPFIRIIPEHPPFHT